MPHTIVTVNNSGTLTAHGEINRRTNLLGLAGQLRLHTKLTIFVNVHRVDQIYRRRSRDDSNSASKEFSLTDCRLLHYSSLFDLGLDDCISSPVSMKLMLF
jgi:hypothetical protein